MFDAFKKLHIVIQLFTVMFSLGFILLIFGGLISEFNTNSPKQEPQKTNISNKKIYLKELTTGDSILSDIFPSPHFKSNELFSFYYSYFGEVRYVTAYINADKRVTKYQILISEKLDSLRLAIQDKLSSENNQPVIFLCETTLENVPPLKWEKQSCEIKSGKQLFTLTEYNLLTKRPPEVPVLDWSHIKRPNVITLTEELDLSKETRDRLNSEKEQEKAQKAEKENKAKMDV